MYLWVTYTFNLLLNTAFFYLDPPISLFPTVFLLSLADSPSPHAGLIYCQKLPEQKTDDGIKKEKQEMSIYVSMYRWQGVLWSAWV